MRSIPILSILIIFFFVSNAHAEMGTLTCHGDDDFPPYSFEENGKLKGIDIDFLDEISKRLGVTFKLDLFPWNRLLVHTKKGLCDCAFSLFKTPEREEYSLYSAPLHYSTYVLFVKTGNEFDFLKISDLYGKKIGKNLGFSISDEFDRAVKTGKIRIKETEGVAKLIKMAIRGQVDGFAGNLNVTQYTLKKLGLSGKLTHLPKALMEKRGAYFVLSKNSKIKNKTKLQKKIADVVNEIHTDGTYQQIIDKHLK
jgi:ABC-type amino acid transport substrate-binding protein